MNPITYYKATQEDIETLTENRIAMALELNGPKDQEKIEELRAQMNTYFRKATAENSCISIIAKIDDEVAGIGSVHLREMPGNFRNPTGKWGYVMNMYTKPEFRKRGICKNILDALVEEGIQCGVKAFELHATEYGESVYKQNGFNIHDEPTYRKFITNTVYSPD